MEAPAHIIEFLKPREGWRTRVYLDTAGHPTAGMGHMLTESERAAYSVGDEIPAETLARWTQADTAGAYTAAVQQAGELGLDRDRAFTTVLASVNYQLGTGWRQKFPQTWAAMRAGRWADAAAMVDGSRWAEQTPARAREFSAALHALGGAGGHGNVRLAGAIALAALGALAIAAAAYSHNSD
jgi:GH24 family phage-related lysozyme (muramidase)